MRERLQDKKKKWEEWERQVVEEERMQKEKLRMQQQQQQQEQQFARRQPRRVDINNEAYQRAYEASESARESMDRDLSEVQRRIQERVKERQRQSGRWIPPEYSKVLVEKGRAAAREARRRREEEEGEATAAEAAAAAQFLAGRVRQKASRFAELVDTMQDAQKERGSGTYTYDRTKRGQKESKEGSVVGEVDVTNTPTWRRMRRNATTRVEYDDAGNLPRDVVRVERWEDDSEGGGGTWVAGTQGSELQGPGGDGDEGQGRGMDEQQYTDW